MKTKQIQGGPLCLALIALTAPVFFMPQANAAIVPSLSDANWVSMGGIPGVNGDVHAAVVDGAGNLYIGGKFTTVGGVDIGYGIAKWDGTNWSPLGSGVGGGPIVTNVFALAVSGSDLYAGGHFTTAGAPTPITLPNGTEPIGARLARG